MEKELLAGFVCALCLAGISSLPHQGGIFTD